MKSNLVRVTLVAVLALTFFSARGVALASMNQPEVERDYGRNFTLDRVDPRVAEAWYWELCAELSEGTTCRVEEVVVGDRKMLAVRGPSRVHAAFARRLAERDLGRATQEFQLLLVAASKTGKGMDDNLPAFAKAALEDVRDLLPFTRFDVIDSGWIQTSSRGQVNLAGRDGTRYEAELVFDPEITVDGLMLSVSGLRVHARIQMPEGGEQVRQLISSSLTLEVGETAVVGTSKLNGGDEALIVLLTALEGRS